LSSAAPSRILVTGFTPWGKIRFNPTGWAVGTLRDNSVPGALLRRVVLPTSYRACERALRAALREFRPDAVVSFGLAERRKRFGVEMAALNVDHAEEPDVSRDRRERRRIDPKGPWVRETRLPVERILRAMKAARVPCGVSYQAGTFVCNHLFYVLLGATRAPAGFVHVPPLPRATVLRGIRAVLGAVVRGA
jgi:pyroglutamyl-peptidase